MELRIVDVGQWTEDAALEASVGEESVVDNSTSRIDEISRLILDDLQRAVSHIHGVIGGD